MCVSECASPPQQDLLNRTAHNESTGWYRDFSAYVGTPRPQYELYDVEADVSDAGEQGGWDMRAPSMPLVADWCGAPHHAATRGHQPDDQSSLCGHRHTAASGHQSMAGGDRGLCECGGAHSANGRPAAIRCPPLHAPSQWVIKYIHE